MKNFIIFYYDLNKDGIPTRPWDELVELYENIEKFFEDKNIEVLMLPRYISHSGVLTRSQTIEILEKYIKEIKESLND